MPGQYVDAESGLFYNWNRYYNPSIGRYISSDPIGLEGGLNTFLYAEASPVMYVDPEGLATSKCIQNPRAVECIVLEGSIGGGRLSGGTGTLRWRTLGKALISSVFGMEEESPDEKAKVASPAKIQGRVCTPASPQGEDLGDDKCEMQALQDENICRTRTMEGTGARSRCWASVQERYGACVAGRTLPPLVTW